MLLDNRIVIALERLAGSLVDLFQIAVLVIEDHIHHRGVEHCLIAQQQPLLLFFLLFLFRDVSPGAENDGGFSFATAAENREADAETALQVLLVLRVVGFYFQCGGFFLLFGYLLDGLHQTLKVCRVKVFRKLAGGIVCCVLAVFFIYGEQLCSHLVAPYLHLRSAQYLCQFFFVLE